MKVAGIYRITDTVADLCYIGASGNLHARLRTHRWMLQNGRHNRRRLQRLWDKHGADAFRFEVLEEVDEAWRLPIREQQYILEAGDRCISLPEMSGASLTGAEDVIYRLDRRGHIIEAIFSDGRIVVIDPDELQREVEKRRMPRREE